MIDEKLRLREVKQSDDNHTVVRGKLRPGAQGSCLHRGGVFHQAGPPHCREGKFQTNTTCISRASLRLSTEWLVHHDHEEASARLGIAPVTNMASKFFIAGGRPHTKNFPTCLVIPNKNKLFHFEECHILIILYFTCKYNYKWRNKYRQSTVYPF